MLPQILPSCTIHGSCGICDILDVAGNVFQFGLALLGVAALVMFVIGANQMLGARGNAEQVAGARKIMTGTVIGVVIVLAAWHLVNIVIFLLIPQQEGKEPMEAKKFPKTGAKIFLNTNPWNQICENEGECFSKGDGALCSSAGVNKKDNGVCMSGVCKGPKEGGFANGCKYLSKFLKDNYPKSKSPNDYECSAVFKKDQECLANLCRDGEWCCGEVERAK